MKNKFLIFCLIVLFMIVSFSGCGGKNKDIKIGIDDVFRANDIVMIDVLIKNNTDKNIELFYSDFHLITPSEDLISLSSISYDNIKNVVIKPKDIAYKNLQFGHIKTGGDYYLRFKKNNKIYKTKFKIPYESN